MAQNKYASAPCGRLCGWIYTTQRQAGRGEGNDKYQRGLARVLRHRQLNFDNIKPTFSFDMHAKAQPKRRLLQPLSSLGNPIARDPLPSVEHIKNCFSFTFVQLFPPTPLYFHLSAFLLFAGEQPNREGSIGGLPTGGGGPLWGSSIVRALI